ncbi:microtubule cross-linking factor 1-like [Salvelinus fontinalis]|uniref:microtubule cross-linking factor 1-like n=1 Tax=Salvelinus fontinalis TaxID=8038 RepID=UPI0024851B7F|nr:microtubule cross-linking factor 1-like [Salvelinus fontinalis]
MGPLCGSCRRAILWGRCVGAAGVLSYGAAVWELQACYPMGPLCGSCRRAILWGRCVGAAGVLSYGAAVWELQACYPMGPLCGSCRRAILWGRCVGAAGVLSYGAAVWELQACYPMGPLCGSCRRAILWGRCVGAAGVLSYGAAVWELQACYPMGPLCGSCRRAILWGRCVGAAGVLSYGAAVWELQACYPMGPLCGSCRRAILWGRCVGAAGVLSYGAAVWELQACYPMGPLCGSCRRAILWGRCVGAAGVLSYGAAVWELQACYPMGPLCGSCRRAILWGRCVGAAGVLSYGAAVWELQACYPMGPLCGSCRRAILWGRCVGAAGVLSYGAAVWELQACYPMGPLCGSCRRAILWGRCVGAAGVLSYGAAVWELQACYKTALRRRGSRETFKDKKYPNQDDSADLRCQLQFSKEESTLMRKKMAKLGREKEELEQEIQQYKSVYGDVDSPLPLAELAGGGPHSTREAELRLRLKLVEEEANILGRKIVELEVENRGLRAENEDIRCQYERDCFGREPFSSMPSSPYDGDALESAGELRRHLQFVEEEAELLRRSISEIEDHNKQLTSELNRFKFGPRDEEVDVGVMLMKTGNGGNGGNGSGVVMMEELKAARKQINELSGKVMKLQYENRVLMSNVQRCDLAQHLGLRTGSPRDSDADSDTGHRDAAEEEETGRLLLLHPKREGPVGGESDSEDLFEKTTTTSGFGSHKPSDEISGLSTTELANLRREDRETFMNVKREAERLGKTVDRLITDTDSLIYEGKIIVTGGDSLCIEGLRAHRGEGSGEDMGDTTTLPESLQDSQVLDTINTRMKAFRTELHIFMEKVDHLGDGLRERGGDRDRGDDLSPMPNLTESSSFLSGVTSMSRDSPISTLGRDLVTDFQSQSGARDELEWRLGQERAVETQGQSQGALPQGPAQNRGAILGHTKYHRPPLASLRPELRDTAGAEMQFRLDHDRRLRPGQEDREAFSGTMAQDEERRRLEVQGVKPRGGLDLTGLQAHEAPWVQERTLLQQEVQLFRHNTVIFYMKLRWILMHWRLGKRTETGEETAHSEYEKLEGIPELILEHGEGETEREDRDRSCTPLPQRDSPDPDPTTQLHSTARLQHQTQAGENRRVLQAVRSLLEEFRSELREEENRRCQLQQNYANDKASWEVKWAEMKCHVAQLEEERREEKGEARGETQGGGDPDWAFKQEREEHRCLLAESHSTSLDLHWKLQHGEKRWGRERRDLLERFDRERQEWDGNMRNMHHKMERLQRELNVRQGSEGSPSDVKEGATAGGNRGVFSPQESPCKVPRSLRSPRSPRSAIHGPVSLSTRSHSDSEAHEEQGAVVRVRGPTENIFLDALTLDSLGSLEVPLPSRLDSDKRFPCMNQALNEIPDIEDPIYQEEEEEEMGCGSLLRAKSVCSMSDFQRLMDSSPFLPDKSRHGDCGRDDVTPPLSPDDLKYIEEFNSKGWGFPVPGPSPTPGHHTPTPMEAWADQPTSEPFQPALWFLTTSATLTTNTLSSPEPHPLCQHSPLRGNGGNRGGGASVHVSHSPTRPPGTPEQDYMYPKGTKGRGGGGEVGDPPGVGGPDEVFGNGRWPSTCHKELLEGGGGLGGGLRGPSGVGPIPTVGYASSLELQLSRNLSDDMKEVAFSVRNYRSGPGTSDLLEQHRQLRDTACQTNGFTTRGTQTTQTISVGLQTDILRTLTSSPHRCLTPIGGGSTPISSPSRNIRKIQYSPVVQSKFERTCCSPKYGSPKLQRKLSTSSKADLPVGASSSSTAGPRAPTPTTPQKGASESAWARSTTTRDSPVHTTINDGLSSLFNIIDHTPVAYEPLQSKFTKSPSRTRTAPPDLSPPAGPGVHNLPPSDPKDPRSLGAAQEFLRNVRGRSPSPVQLILETPGGPGGTGGERTPEVVSIRQDLSAPPGYTLAENAARLLNKKLLEQSFREEKRLGSAGQSREGRHGEGDRNQAGCMEDLPRSPVAPPLESCFLRPARPANRRPPSRWAVPSSHRGWRDVTERRFTFPMVTGTSKTGTGTTSSLDLDETGPAES